MAVFLSLVSFAVMLLVMHLIADQFYQVACEKGWDERKYYWLSFLLGIVGWLLVVALPDRRPTPVVVNNPTPAAPAQQFTNNELPPL